MKYLKSVKTKLLYTLALLSCGKLSAQEDWSFNPNADTGDWSDMFDEIGYLGAGFMGVMYLGCLICVGWAVWIFMGSGQNTTFKDIWKPVVGSIVLFLAPSIYAMRLIS